MNRSQHDAQPRTEDGSTREQRDGAESQGTRRPRGANRLSIEGTGLRRKLFLIEVLVFLLPMLVLIYLYYPHIQSADYYKLFIIALMLLLILCGLLLLRQIIDRTFMLRNFLVKAAGEDQASDDLKQKSADELHEITNYFNNLMREFEGTTSELKRRVFELFTIKDLTEVASKSLDINELMDILLEKAMTVTTAQTGSVFMVEEDKENFRVVAAKGQDASVIKDSLVAISESVASCVVSTHEPLLVEDIEKDSRTSGLHDVKYGHPSFLSMPVFIREQLIGVLNLAHKENRQIFHSNDKQILSIMIREMGFALENAKLHSQLKEHMQDLQERSEELTAINEQLQQEIKERKKAEEALSEARDNLEQRVKERSRELIRTNEQLNEEIEERKRAEEALRESEERYRSLYKEAKRAEQVYESLLHSSADPIILYDLEGRVQYINPAFTQIFGWTLEEIGSDEIPFVPESEQEPTESIFGGLLDKGTPCHGFETKRLTKDGYVLDVSISASRYDDHEGSPSGVLVIIRDITERRKLQAQLERAQRMEAIGTLAGGVAHDFNNLLTGIQGRAYLMLLDVDETHPHHEHLKAIEESVQSAADLTKQLLGFARGGKYEVKPTDLNDIVKKSADMFGRTKKEISIHQNLEESIWTVEADQGQIEQVLLNLYVNAWQAMPGGGDLYLETKNVFLDEHYTRPYQVSPGHYVQVSVTDTGVGMDKETQQRIFDPFYTTKEMGRGTGLGLASVYGIIKNHEGFINVYSEAEQGSTFNVYLPVVGGEAEAAKTQPDQADLPRGKETVMLVDDEETVIDVGTKLLEMLGYSVITARGGKEALQLHQNNGHSIDLVVLDMIMPDMGGGETFDQLKAAQPDLKVLLSSGYSLNDQAKEILSRGCDAFIQKPFNMQELSRKLREVLES
jgi:PAS domain S-box-containing protein